MLHLLRLVPVRAGWSLRHREACFDVDGETRRNGQVCTVDLSAAPHVRVTRVTGVRTGGVRECRYHLMLGVIALISSAGPFSQRCRIGCLNMSENHHHHP